MLRRAPRRGSAAALITGLLIALGTADAAEAGCRGAAARAANASQAKLRGALLCIVNRKRAAYGLTALGRDRRIQRAAGRHARDMVRNGYFAHQRPGGPDLTERLARAGWHGRAWGETIAYGCGRQSTARATVRNWMNSPPHRAILLSADYRGGGVGVAGPAPCGGGAMWVLDVGRK